MSRFDKIVVMAEASMHDRLVLQATIITSQLLKTKSLKLTLVHYYAIWKIWP